MPASIFNGDAIRILKEKLKFKSGLLLITNDTDDPTSVAKDAPQGSIYIRSGTTEIYNKDDNGSSTNWTRIDIDPNASIKALTNTKSVNFDGVNDFVDIPVVSAINPTTQISVFCWVKGFPQSNIRFNGHFQPTGNQRKWQMGTSSGANDDKLSVFVSGDGTSTLGKQRITTNPVFDNNWHHVGFTFNAGTLLVYVDGVIAPVSIPLDAAFTTLHSSTANLEIGSQGEGSALFFTGNVDEQSIWDKALSAAEISEMYNDGVPTDLSNHSTSANLVHWLRMGDGDTFPTLTDQQGNSNGTMTNMDSGDIESDVVTASLPADVSRWKKFTVSHTDLQAASTTNDIELMTLGPKELIHEIVIKHSTAFAGTGITAYTASVGIIGTLDKYATAFDIFQATGDTIFQVSNVTNMEDFGSTTSIRIAAISTGANLDQSSAGSVDIWIKTSTLI